MKMKLIDQFQQEDYQYFIENPLDIWINNQFFIRLVLDCLSFFSKLKSKVLEVR